MTSAAILCLDRLAFYGRSRSTFLILLYIVNSKLTLFSAFFETSILFEQQRETSIDKGYVINRSTQCIIPYRALTSYCFVLFCYFLLLFRFFSLARLLLSIFLLFSCFRSISDPSRSGSFQMTSHRRLFMIRCRCSREQLSDFADLVGA